MIKAEIRNKLHFYIAESDFSFGNLIKSSLRHIEMKQVSMITNRERLDAVVNAPELKPSVLLIDNTFVEGGIQDYIHQIRSGSIGSDPFMLVFGTITLPTQTLVNQLSTCGIDELFIKPYSTQSIIQRINNIAIGRKPYIVTSDYLGPDRRRANERDQTEEQDKSPLQIKHFSVPNPLKMLLQNEYTSSGHARERDKAIKAMNIERISNFLFQLAFNSTIVSALHSHKQHTELMKSHFDSIGDFVRKTLQQSAENIPGNLTIPNAVRPIGQLLASLSSDSLEKAQIGKLEKLSLESLCAIHPDADPAIIAAEVKRSATNYLKKIT